MQTGPLTIRRPGRTARGTGRAGPPSPLVLCTARGRAGRQRPLQILVREGGGTGVWLRVGGGRGTTDGRAFALALSITHIARACVLLRGMAGPEPPNAPQSPALSRRRFGGRPTRPRCGGVCQTLFAGPTPYGAGARGVCVWVGGSVPRAAGGRVGTAAALRLSHAAPRPFRIAPPSPPPLYCFLSLDHLQRTQRLGRVGLASCAVAVYDASPSRASAPRLAPAGRAQRDTNRGYERDGGGDLVRSVRTAFAHKGRSMRGHPT